MIPRCLAALALAPLLGAQNGPGIQQPPFKSELLDTLAGGFWTMTGTAGNHPVHGGADAEWILNHLYLRLHVKEAEGAESIIYIGYDTYDQRLVAIRLDSISARGAETNGYGQLPTGNVLQFSYDYPTVPFRHTYTWDPQAKTWTFLVESKDRKTNTWHPVSNMTLRRVQGLGRRGPGGPGGPGTPGGFPPHPPAPQQPPQPQQ